MDSTALFTEFYFDVNDQHRITAGLRYNEDTKGVSVNATFYKVPVISNWAANMQLANGIGGTCGIDPATGQAGSVTYTLQNGLPVGLTEKTADFLTKVLKVIKLPL